MDLLNLLLYSSQMSEICCMCLQIKVIVTKKDGNECAKVILMIFISMLWLFTTEYAYQRPEAQIINISDAFLQPSSTKCHKNATFCYNYYPFLQLL